MHDKAGEHAKHLDFIVCDLVSIEIALIAAYLIRIDRAEDAVYFEFYRNINIVILVLYLVIMLFASFHKGILKRGYLKELAAVVTTNVELMLSLLAVLFMLKESQTYSRVLFGMFAVFSVILMYILRTIRKKVLWKRFRDHKENSNVLIVTHRENAKVIYDSLQKDNNGYYDYLGFVDLDGGEGGDILGLPSIALDQVLSYCKENAKQVTAQGALVSTQGIRNSGIQGMPEKFHVYGVAIANRNKDEPLLFEDADDVQAQTVELFNSFVDEFLNDRTIASELRVNYGVDIEQSLIDELKAQAENSFFDVASSFPNKKMPITETLFFWPLKNAIYNIAKG